jgi:DNA-binding transcriptional LysR family regulator
MDIRQIRYFVAVAETLNFRRAAERLDMAQPPLSLAIRRLEEELQVRLFDRTNRSVKLTQAGVVFLEEARLTVKQLDHAVAVAQQAATSRPGSLRIGFPASSLFWLLPSS